MDFSVSATIYLPAPTSVGACPPSAHIGCMSKITKISPQSKDPTRVSVFLDGQFAFGLPKRAAAEMNLTVGRDLTKTELEALHLTVDDNKVYDRLLRLLGIRAHAKAELRRKLTAKGVDPAAVDRAITRAVDAGYIDDTQFAADFSRHARDQRGWAPARTRMELRKRGVDREIAEIAVAEVFSETDLLEQAIDLAHSRAARLTGDRESRRRRLVGYLARRGYPTSVCRKAADEVAP